MYKLFFSSVLLFFGVTLLPAQLSFNMDLYGQVKRSDDRYSGSWSYIAGDGTEYALIGAFTGLVVYRIDDPQNIQEVGFVPGPHTRWREITTLGDFAYVVTDVMGSGHSMQVVDLSYLPDSVSLLTSYDSTFTDGHIIQRDIYTDSAYVYVIGTTATRGVHIMDVSEPAAPQEIGLYEPGYYIHDCHVNGELLFGAAFNEGTIDVVDISDKRNPSLITRFEVPGGAVHSSWLTEDKRFLVVCQERDGLPSRIFDVSDLDNITEVATYTANTESLVHNPYIKGQFCYFSHNTEGLRVVDIADPALPVEVAYYDTWLGASGGFNGLWSACPFYPSGKIIGGNRDDGLYIFTFNQTRAARIYGIVKDAVSGEVIEEAIVLFQPDNEILSLGLDHQFKKGVLAGSYTLEVQADGYEPASESLFLTQGDSLWVEVLLQPITIATEEVALQRQLQIYPNPADQQAVFDLNAFPEASELIIFDVNGKVVDRRDVRQLRRYHWQAAQLPAAVYYYVLTDEQAVRLASGRVVVQ